MDEMNKKIIYVDVDGCICTTSYDIKDWEKYRERKDLGIRNHPESCMERMLSDDQVHGI